MSAEGCGCDPEAHWICDHHRTGPAPTIAARPNPRFHALLAEIGALHDAKSHDYATQQNPLQNFHRSAAFGVEPWRGVLVRMSDKWSRIEQLVSGKTPKNESLRDSLIDNAVYSLICVLLLEGE